jgi:hypothetical protein
MTLTGPAAPSPDGKGLSSRELNHGSGFSYQRLFNPSGTPCSYLHSMESMHGLCPQYTEHCTPYSVQMEEICPVPSLSYAADPVHWVLALRERGAVPLWVHDA